MVSSTNRLREFVRAAFVSPEAVWIAVVLLGATMVPQWLLKAGAALLTGEVVIVVAVLGGPFAFVGAAYRLSGSVLRPHGDRAVLRSWPDYWRLRLRVMVALAYTFTGAIAVTLGWIIYKSGSPLFGSVVSLCGGGVTAIALATIAHAKQDVEDIIDRLS